MRKYLLALLLSLFFVLPVNAQWLYAPDSGHSRPGQSASSGGEAVDISGKADKVSGATTGNFAGLDASGNLTDSEKSSSDFLGASDSTVTKQGNSFNGNSQLVQTTADGKLPALSGENLTDLPSSGGDYDPSNVNIYGGSISVGSLTTTGKLTVGEAFEVRNTVMYGNGSIGSDRPFVHFNTTSSSATRTMFDASTANFSRFVYIYHSSGSNNAVINASGTDDFVYNGNVYNTLTSTSAGSKVTLIAFDSNTWIIWFMEGFTGS